MSATTVTVDNLRRRKSGTTGNNLGGAMHADEVSNNTVNNFWRKISEVEIQSGVTIYRGFYVLNNNTTDSLKNVIFYFSTPVTNSGITVSFGHGTSGINATSIEQTIPNEFTAPAVRASKWYVNPGDRVDGMPIDGEIKPGQHAFVWMRMVVPSGTQSSIFTHYRMRVEIFNPAASGNIPEDFGITFFANPACVADSFGSEDSTGAFTNMTKRNHEWIQCCGNLSPMNADPTCIFDRIKSTGMKPKMKMCLGFTEDETTKKNRIKTEFAMGSDYYSYDVYNVHITVMKYETSYNVGNAHYNWVKNDLETARQRPGIEWLIVVVNDIFYPPKKDGQYVQFDPNDDELFDASLRDTYHPLFNANFVHLVMTGGANLYMRTFALKYNSAAKEDPDPVQVDQGQTLTWFDKGMIDGGCVFVNVGTCGLFANSTAHPMQNPGTKAIYAGIGSASASTRKNYVVLQFSNFGKKCHILGYRHSIDELSDSGGTIEKVQPP